MCQAHQQSGSTDDGGGACSLARGTQNARVSLGGQWPWFVGTAAGKGDRACAVSPTTKPSANGVSAAPPANAHGYTVLVCWQVTLACWDMLNVHAYLLRTDEKMAATMGFERLLAPPASDAAPACIAQLQSRFLGLAHQNTPPWIVRVSSKVEDELMVCIGRSSFRVEICARGIGAASTHAILAKLNAVPHLTHLALRCMRSLLDFGRQRGEGGRRR